MEKAPYPYAGLPPLSPDPEPSFGATLEEQWAREFGVSVYLEENGGLGRLLDALRLGAFR